MPRQAIQTSDYDFTVTQTPLYTVRDEDNKKAATLPMFAKTLARCWAFALTVTRSFKTPI